MSTSAAGAAGGKDGAAKKKSPIVLILIVIILLLVGAGAGGFFYFKNQAAHPGPVKLPPPVFYPLEAFTVNLSGDDGDTHYLHVGLTLSVPSAETIEKLKVYLPEIRSRILLLLSSKRPEDLASVAGKTKLSTEVQQAIEKPFSKDGTSVKIESVLLTDFVIQ